MSREKIFKLLFLALIALLLLLVFRFKPTVIGPKNLEKPPLKEGNAVLSGKNFHYEVKDKNILKYTLYAEEILERDEQEKELKNPFISIPKEEGKTDNISADKGLFSPNKSELRLYENAKIVTSDNFKIMSSGFRVTPQNEVVSEGRADFEKDKLKGSGEILRYDREKRIAYLEGNIKIYSENLFFEASTLFIDLKNHNGRIEGPVKGKKDDIFIFSPGGSIFLNSKNNLEYLILEEPANGETQNFTFSSRNIRFDFSGSNVGKFTLIDNAVIEKKAEPKSKLQTQTILFEKVKDNLWNFTAPSKMLFEQSNAKLECTKGKGLIDKGEITADFEGPVRGRDDKTEISSANAKLYKDYFEFIGNAQAVSLDGNVTAERITAYKSGDKEALGDVKGEIFQKDKSKILFSSTKAKISPSLFPVRLLGDVVVESSTFNLKGTDFSFYSNKKFSGCNGVYATFEENSGNINGYGKEVDYNEEKGSCIFSGDPYIFDNGKKLSAKNKIIAYFNEGRKIKEILAEEEAKFESEKQTAIGDSIIYNLESKKGVVSSETGIAEVIEKEPFKRCIGRKISFAEKELAIKGSDKKTSRGKIEGREVKEKR
ncbi:MAG: LPS export ABC transporter periplasmic protein LptC [Acidobacteria bacterium]|nr:LPS export ABC transporter periplasmic protein LptC [Acidobacteriota bacterium]